MGLHLRRPVFGAERHPAHVQRDGGLTLYGESEGRLPGISYDAYTLVDGGYTLGEFTYTAMVSHDQLHVGLPPSPGFGDYPAVTCQDSRF